MHAKQSANRSHTTFFTVGHSNRTIEEFIDILRQGRIGIVVDVRRLPGSRAYPQFDSERLAASLAEAQIAYEIVAPLGGRRGKVDGVSPETNGAWRNQSFHNYADYALSAQFRGGLDRLLAIRTRRCAIMCSEAVWWRCHRRVIADYLLARGEEVFHLMGNGRVEKAVPTAGAVLRDDGSVIYPSVAAC
ncbi:DUF488 domain-containing protein [Mesorhizobium sp. B4-1-3]|uniref:DUF488 domain-containing protein n=1 Tax=Mesorhizobium sp. B4-1-3 TaxID=2589889 RepID=UPI00112B0A6F|nr:DUF488 domain-containing protein [Mesorhizobium sp. B4-1-3]TPI11227.1 DUF488 domain-containing protein [Mesorhizobium sp. B4-1-3]